MNRLAQEKSPYLLQHQNNPVDWYPWGEDAFERARSTQKPIFLSIGYSTCYWCHVMEKDSFEREDVAAFLNENFVSIKVDREERPDVDKIYMDAVVALTGHGGWPMSVFLTTDAQPFFGGTYFPRSQFLQILTGIAEVWSSQRENVLTSAQELTSILGSSATRNDRAVANVEYLQHSLEELKRGFDPIHGGFGPAPKFPHSTSISLLLRIYRRTQNAEALSMARHSLEKMARGGIFDQLGGGFHRYSTDREWLVPHFEKMLYDNALLAWTYLEAFQATKDSLFSETARATLEYLLRDMRAPGGAFYSAQDAGEVNKEGEYYVWTEKELRSLLSPEEFAELSAHYGVSSSGNFEHGSNIFYRATSEPSPTNSTLQSARNKLLAARFQRQAPHLDDKILTSWNGLTISALARAAQVLQDNRYRIAAEEAATFIREGCWSAGRLKHRYRDGEARYSANIDDYAFLIEGLLNLYETNFDSHWLSWALELQQAQDEVLLDNNDGSYFFSDPKDSLLIARRKDFRDGAEPAGNAVSLLNQLRLSQLNYDNSRRARAERLLERSLGGVRDYPSTYGTLMFALDYALDRSKEIAVIGKLSDRATQALLNSIYQQFQPNKVLACAETEQSEPALLKGKVAVNGKPTVYVCESKTCQAPVQSVEDLERLLGETKGY